MAGVGARLLKVSLDALAVSLLPRALAVVTSAHQPRACARACGHTGVGLAEHAWACMGVGPQQG